MSITHDPSISQAKTLVSLLSPEFFTLHLFFSSLFPPPPPPTPFDAESGESVHFHSTFFFGD